MEILTFIILGAIWQKVNASPVIGPSSSFQHENREIGIFHQQLSYNKAAMRCREWGQGLVIIDSKQLQTALEEHIRRMNVYDPTEWANDDLLGPAFYVGAQDSNEEGTWKWRDSSIVPLPGSDLFHNWGPIDPNNFGAEWNIHGEDCMVFLIPDVFPHRGYSTGTWMDVQCSLEKFYICEKEITSTPTLLYEICPSVIMNGMAHLRRHTYSACSDSGAISYVTGWHASPSVYKWFVQRTGYHLEMTTAPKRALRSNIDGQKLFVNKVILKTSPSSSNSFGRKRINVEIMITHEKHPTMGDVVFSFPVRERNNPANKDWQRFLMPFLTTQSLAPVFEITTSILLESLLSELHGRRRTRTRHIVENPVRHKINLHRGCGNVTSFVFPHSVYFSTAQIVLLQSLTSGRRTIPRHSYTSRNVCIL